MADLYRVIYNTSGPEGEKAVVVSATSEKNAADAAKNADINHKGHITATVLQHNIITGS